MPSRTNDDEAMPAAALHGQLRFEIPLGWVEEHDTDGSVVYSDAENEGGVLRVKLLTFTSPDTLTPAVAVDELQAIPAEPGQSIEQLPNGNALRSHREESVAAGERTCFHVWMLAGIDPPHRMRLGVFSFAVLARDATSATTRRVVGLFDRAVREARFVHQIA